jgi:membrane-associated phospholipid phosphatase
VAGSFAGLGFLSWYLAGKITAFDRRGHIAKLCVVILPLLLAALVATSRVDDYWHHWQDVFTGGILGTLLHEAASFSFNYSSHLLVCADEVFHVYAGMVVASICYLQFFPAPSNENGMLLLEVAFWLTSAYAHAPIIKII